MIKKKSPLTERQWKKVEKRFLAGETASALAREYGVTEGAIRKRYSTTSKQIKTVAKQVAEAEIAFNSLANIGTKVLARTLADELIEISSNLSGTARNGSSTAKHLSNVANAKAILINKDNFDLDKLKDVAALTQVVNESAKTGLALLAINKDAMAKHEKTANVQVYDENLLPEDAYKRMINASA